MVAAPSDHWVHEYHQFDTLKDQSNPYMGELLNLEHKLHQGLFSLDYKIVSPWLRAGCQQGESRRDANPVPSIIAP